jgi:trehalose 6-phosphate phosphatase
MNTSIRLRINPVKAKYFSSDSAERITGIFEKHWTVAPAAASWHRRIMTVADAPPLLAEIPRAALFLDFDGTLVALADRPDAIAVPPSLPPLLDRLATVLEGRLAIVTGRALADLDTHLAAPHLAASGSHGLERRGQGAASAEAAPPALAAARAALADFSASDPGLLLEDKPASVALHYRLAPHREAEVLALAAEVSARTGLVAKPGKMVIELRPPGADKGDAVRALMAEPPFAGARPVFVRDDLTDEDGFRAAAALGGFGVLVGAGRDTAACYRLPGIPDVHAWLEAGAARG